MSYTSKCEHGKEFNQKISGTQARETLRQGKILPEWFMRESVSRLILEELKNGSEVFVD
jgi:ATP sulfurylase